MPEIDYDLLAEKITQKLGLTCSCGLTTDEQKEVRHFVGMVSDVGDGDLSKGVESFREVGKRFKRMTKVSEWLARAILVGLVAASLSGTVYVIKKGIEFIIKEMK
jgi:hypothetical protein